MNRVASLESIFRAWEIMRPGVLVSVQFEPEIYPPPTSLWKAGYHIRVASTESCTLLHAVEPTLEAAIEKAWVLTCKCAYDELSKVETLRRLTAPED